MRLFKHADGGLYRLTGARSGKLPDTGEWVPGIDYQDAAGRRFWTVADRFRDRFKEVEVKTRGEAARRAHPWLVLASLLMLVAGCMLTMLVGDWVLHTAPPHGYYWPIILWVTIPSQLGCSLAMWRYRKLAADYVIDL